MAANPTCTQGVYLLGTSLARPVIARGMMDIVVQENCQCVSLSELGLA